MDPKQAWEQALGQLQLEMNKATFDTWVRDSVFLAFENGIFRIGAPNELAKDWLKDRLTGVVKKILTGIVGNPVEIQFLVQEDRYDDAQPVPEVDVNTVYATCTEEFLKSDRITTIPQYLWRLSNILKPVSTCRYISMRQVAYKNGQRDTRGSFSTTLRELASYSGMDHTTWLRGIKSDYEEWLFVRKNKKAQRMVDPITKRKYTLPIQYTYFGTLPLSPSDQESVREWLRLNAVEKDPAGTLQRALDLRRSALLSSTLKPPPGAVAKTPQTIEDIVLSLCSIPDRQISQVRELAQQLQSRIVGGWDPVQLYFIETVMPLIGHKKGLLVLWLRHLALKRDSDQLDQGENLVTIKGGFGEIERVLAIDKDTARMWFSQSRKNKKDPPLLWQYAELVERGKYSREGSPLLFRVPINTIPLIDEHRKLADKLFLERVNHAKIVLKTGLNSGNK